MWMSVCVCVAHVICMVCGCWCSWMFVLDGVGVVFVLVF